MPTRTSKTRKLYVVPVLLLFFGDEMNGTVNEPGAWIDG